ncbi:MAG: tryptophan-rich sensory protein, partial [bacterium]|nr:tryptophan-rich sensory protein [bacterium]
MIKRDYFTAALWVVTFEAIGFVLGFLTKNNIKPWYNVLIKSNLTPPPIVFSITWSLLYAMLALVAWVLWERRHSSSKMRLIWNLFSMQLVMNWLWTPLFFHFHLLGFSFVWLISLAALTFYLIYMLS